MLFLTRGGFSDVCCNSSITVNAPITSQNRSLRIFLLNRASCISSNVGNGGWFFILLGVALILFKNTRKTGLAVLLSLLFGAIFTNIILKPLRNWFRSEAPDALSTEDVLENGVSSVCVAGA